MPRQKKEPRVKEVAISFVRRLQIEEKTCPACKKRFQGIRKQTYCSPACRSNFHYALHADQLRQRRRDAYHRQKADAAHP